MPWPYGKTFMTFVFVVVVLECDGISERLLPEFTLSFAEGVEITTRTLGVFASLRERIRRSLNLYATFAFFAIKLLTEDSGVS